MSRGEGFLRHQTGGHEPIPSTYRGFLVGVPPFLDRPPLEVKSQVAITRALNYRQAEDAVREAIYLLGGIERFCGQGDQVMIKPNLVFDSTPEMGETTHPAVVAAMVKMCKEAGATVRVGEKAGLWLSTKRTFKYTGIEQAALEAGADEVVYWDEHEYVEVDVPNARSFAKVKVPESVYSSNVFIDLPKLKNNWLMGSRGLTLAVKSKLGILPQKDRAAIHKQPQDMAAGCVDVAKAIHHKHRLTLIDGIEGVEGATHYGLLCRPGLIIASPDLVAAEAVAHAAVGYHPLESPGVQFAMKEGLGTGDLAEIDILGCRLQDVIYPFLPHLPRYVQKYLNVKEYVGGTCVGCHMAQMGVPPLVDSKKKYAVLSGTRIMVAGPLEGVDEAWLVGECACRADHQYPGYMEKVNAAKKVIKMGDCPGHESLYHGKWGGIYDLRFLASVDMAVATCLPETVRPNVLARAEARREGRETEFAQAKPAIEAVGEKVR